METLYSKALLLALILVPPMPATAEVNVRINIPVPPAIVFPVPPALIVIPETYVYVIPDIEEDIFFYHGWWWRSWNGYWYRSKHYNSGWTPDRHVPSFYRHVPVTWREDYRHRRWKGHRWDAEPIPRHQLQSHWKAWERGDHWQTRNHWGVQGLKPHSRDRESSLNHRPGPAQSGQRGQQFHKDPAHEKSGQTQFRETRSNGNPAGRSGKEKEHGKRFDR